MDILTCLKILESNMNIIQAVCFLRDFLKSLNPDYVYSLNGHDKINFQVILSDQEQLDFYDYLADYYSIS